MKKYIKGTFLAILLVTLAAFMLTGCGKQKIDLRDYVDVKISGGDGYGHAYASLDEDSLFAAVSEGSDDDADTWNTLLLLDGIDVELDVTEGLSNGDNVTVTVTYPEKLGDALNANISPKSGKSWTVTVSGLEQMQEIDPFDGLDVVISGYDGYGTAEVRNDSSYAFDYALSQNERLSNGDTVTLTLAARGGGDFQEYCIEHYGVIPTATSKDYPVAGLETAKQIDLFEDIDITLQGYSPYLRISIFGKYENDGIRYEMETDNNGNWRIGDTVTIRAISDDWSGEISIEEECLNSLGGLPVTDTYSYTIGEGTPYYITDANEISKRVLDDLISEAADYFEAEDKADELSVQSASYYGYYLQTAKRYDGWEDCNRIYILHEVNYTMDGKSSTHYNAVEFGNVYIENGECHYEYAKNLYGWSWGETGVASIYDFEKERITPDAADYRYVSGQ